MTLKDQIQQAQHQLAECIAARNAEQASSLYTADACFMPHGAPTCKGQAAIAQFYQGVFSGGIASARFTTEDVEGDEQQAVEVGRYELFAAGNDGGAPVAVATGRYLAVWRKVGGAWRMHRDMFNPI